MIGVGFDRSFRDIIRVELIERHLLYCYNLFAKILRSPEIDKQNRIFIKIPPYCSFNLLSSMSEFSILGLEIEIRNCFELPEF